MLVMIKSPASAQGPHLECAHTKCAMMREIASQGCSLCGAPIGYNKTFVKKGGVITHTGCILLAERKAEQMLGRRGHQADIMKQFGGTWLNTWARWEQSRSFPEFPAIRAILQPYSDEDLSGPVHTRVDTKTARLIAATGMSEQAFRAKAATVLDPQLQDILLARSGLDTVQSLRALAEKYNCGQDKICNLEDKALRAIGLLPTPAKAVRARTAKASAPQHKSANRPYVDHAYDFGA